MTLEEKERFLLKSTYSANDVKFLTNLAKSRVSVIMNICREKYGGTVPYRANVITAKSFWLYEGTTIDEEYRLLGIAKGYVRR